MDSQDEKAYSPIDVTCDGMLIFARDLQLENAYAPIVVIDSGSVIDESERQFENASALNICGCAGHRGFSVYGKVCMISRMTVSCMEILCVCSFCGM